MTSTASDARTIYVTCRCNNEAIRLALSAAAQSLRRLAISLRANATGEGVRYKTARIQAREG